MADQNASGEKSSYTTRVKWPQKSKLEIDTFISRGDETQKEEISTIREVQRKFEESGATGRAKKLEEYIEGIQKNMATIQKLRKYASYEVAEFMSEEEKFEKESTDTTRRMREDIDDRT
jgi:hypothetical protein